MTDFSRVYLPWFVAAAALVLYLLTLNQWVTLTSLPVVAKVTGWDWWSPTLEHPLFYALTFPLRHVSPSWQVTTLNFLSAIAAAFTLWLLARSVALLPHDRTREQRQRERSEYNLLTIPGNWLAPLLAVGICGLQSTFWQHATTATGEMLDLLIFAYVIRCLLEYRLRREDRWLYKLALVYGLGTANNWALAGFFPVFLAAVIALKRKNFFESRFFLRMLGLGLAGLSLYLLLPAVTAASGATTASFWQMLRTEMGAQKSILFLFPKGRVLLLALTSLLPVLFLAIRWPASFGETSAAGTIIANFMFRVIHVFLLAATVWVAFDPLFSPRALGYGLPFLTFYYLGALAAGYYCGYLLLVFGRSTGKAWERPSAVVRVINAALMLAAGLCVFVAPVLLVIQNGPKIRAYNGPALKSYARELAESLPAGPAIVLSDQPGQLLLVAALEQGRASEHLLVDTRYLPYTEFHRKLKQRHPHSWPGFAPGVKVPDMVRTSDVNQLITYLTRTNRVCYLQPSFGRPYFESAYLQPASLCFTLTPYPTNAITPPPPTEPQRRSNQVFWERARELLAGLQDGLAQKVDDALTLGGFYSASANSWGVELQRMGRLDEAARLFDLALEFSGENEAARINQQSNRKLRRQPVSETKETEERIFIRYPTWATALTAYGPIDDSKYCYRLGLSFIRFDLLRQAAIQFQRALELAPGNLAASLALADVWLRAGRPDAALKLVASARAATTLTAEDDVQLTRAEAAAQLRRNDFPAAEKLLLAARQKYPKSPEVLDTLAQAYLVSGRLTNALAVMEQQLQLQPDNFRILVNQGAARIQAKDFTQALTALDRALKLQPDNLGALVNRAIARLNLGQFEGAEQDYRQLKEKMPGSPAPFYGLGEIALRRNNVSEAVAQFEAGLKLDSPQTPAGQFMARRVQELKQGHK